jgi:MFS family permease
MTYFGVSETLATLPLTTYVLGLAFGPMLSAPISETFGRLGTYRVAVPVAALFTVGAGFAPNIQALCILRFFAGFFGGAPLPVASGSAADMFRSQHFAIAGSFILYFPFLGPAVGPVVGGFATQDDGWKWTQFVLAITMIVVWIPVLFLEETYLKIILARRETKAAEKHSEPPASKLLLGVLFVTLFRPMKMLITEPIVTLLSIYVAFGFAVVFTFFSSVPYVFGLVYEFDIGNSGLVFLSIALGCTIAVPTIILLDRMTYQKQARRTGKAAPELRLWPAMYGAIGLPASLFW